MKKIKNFTIFILLPVMVVGLLFLNGKIATEKYSDSKNDLSKLKQYDAVINSEKSKIELHTGEDGRIKLSIKNAGTMTWISQPQNGVDVSYHLMDMNNKVIKSDGERTPLPNAVKSGETVEVNMLIKAPENEGNYKVEIDMVHEGVTWFKKKGSDTLIINLKTVK